MHNFTYDVFRRLEIKSIHLTDFTGNLYTKMNSMGDSLRTKLNSIFDELEIDNQITGIGSLFGINFNEL